MENQYLIKKSEMLELLRQKQAQSKNLDACSWFEATQQDSLASRIQTQPFSVMSDDI
jgi:hypothetical protein